MANNDDMDKHTMTDDIAAAYVVFTVSTSMWVKLPWI